MRIQEQQYPPGHKHPRPRIDEEQLALDREMTPEDRFHAVCEMTEFVMELQDAAAARRHGKILLGDSRRG